MAYNEYLLEGVQVMDKKIQEEGEKDKSRSKAECWHHYCSILLNSVIQELNSSSGSSMSGIQCNFNGRREDAFSIVKYVYTASNNK